MGATLTNNMAHRGSSALFSHHVSSCSKRIQRALLCSTSHDVAASATSRQPTAYSLLVSLNSHHPPTQQQQPQPQSIRSYYYYYYYYYY